MTESCKKRVYARMCEKDNGRRVGKYGRVMYVSTRKYARKTASPTKKRK